MNILPIRATSCYCYSFFSGNRDRGVPAGGMLYSSNMQVTLQGNGHGEAGFATSPVKAIT